MKLQLEVSSLRIEAQVAARRMMKILEWRMRLLQHNFLSLWYKDQNNWSQLIPLPQQIKTNLLWWGKEENLLYGFPLLEPSWVKIYMGASAEGWWTHWLGHSAQGFWHTNLKDVPSNVFELRAIDQALSSLSGFVDSSAVKIRSDNKVKPINQ